MFNILQIAGSALGAQSIRLNAVASNLANADSVAGPGNQPYRAKQVIFQSVPLSATASAGVKASQIVEDASPGRLVFQPGHPLANKSGYVEMPNVNVVDEMVNMISASRSYQNNAEVMASTKSLIQKTLQIGS